MASLGGAEARSVAAPSLAAAAAAVFVSLMEVVISVAAGSVSSARLTGWLALAATANVIHLFSASDGAMSDGFSQRNNEKQPANHHTHPKQAAGGVFKGKPSVHAAAGA